MQDILIHVRSYRNQTAATRYGARFAAQCGASVTGVYTCALPNYAAPSYHPELIAAIVESTRVAIRDAVAAGPAFVGGVTGLGVKRCDWLVADGDPAEALAQAATRHDVLVLDRPGDDRSIVGDLPSLIFKAGIPCLLAPRAEADAYPIERITIGWNASPESLRAVHAALPLLEGKQVLLVRGEERPRYGVEWTPEFDIVKYLERRGAIVHTYALDAKSDVAGEALIEQARQFRSDLLVMGAYGRSRFSEWLLGGATRDVLTLAELPVLLAR